MTDEQIDAISETYVEATEAIDLPEGWWVWVTDQATALEKAGWHVEGHPSLSEAIVFLVDESGCAHWVCQHSGPIKQVHAEQHLEEKLTELG